MKLFILILQSYLLKSSTKASQTRIGWKLIENFIVSMCSVRTCHVWTVILVPNSNRARGKMLSFVYPEHMLKLTKLQICIGLISFTRETVQSSSSPSNAPLSTHRNEGFSHERIAGFFPYYASIFYEWHCVVFFIHFNIYLCRYMLMHTWIYVSTYIFMFICVLYFKKA